MTKPADQTKLEMAIAALVLAFEDRHHVEVSSLWVEHSTRSSVEVKVTIRERVRA